MFFSLWQPCHKLVTYLKFNPSLFTNTDPECGVSVDRKWMDGWMLWEVLDHRGSATVHVYAQYLQQTQLHYANAVKSVNIRKLTLEEIEQME